MTQLEIAQVLAMIKLQDGSEHIKVFDLPRFEIFEALLTRGYLKAIADEPIEDDEGIMHKSWAYAFTDKAHNLLRRKSRELSMRPLR